METHNEELVSRLTDSEYGVKCTLFRQMFVDHFYHKPVGFLYS